jgi:hypothetical protein
MRRLREAQGLRAKRVHLVVDTRMDVWRRLLSAQHCALARKLLRNSLASGPGLVSASARPSSAPSVARWTRPSPSSLEGALRALRGRSDTFSTHPPRR